MEHTTERTDCHRPSVLQPEDYVEVGIWTMNIQGFGDAQAAADARFIKTVAWA